MKIIKKGELVHGEEGESVSFDIPIEEVAEAFGVSTTFFIGAFEAGQVEATAEEDEDGTIVITFRMGEMELTLGVSAEEDEEEDGYPSGHA